MSFYQKLDARWQAADSLVCVGLDPDPDRMPATFRDRETPIFDFNKEIIDHTAPFVCAYKPQIAYYAATGAEAELGLTIDYLRAKHPDVPVILDAKRGDIGSTARQYALEAFERFGADAVTVNPYMGGDSLEPFLQWKDRGVILLCRTSNPGSADIQTLDCDGKAIYQIVAEMAAGPWNEHQNIALVVGATQPDELRVVRGIIGDRVPLLVPGVGAQGGSAKKTVLNGQNSQGAGLMVNSSRGILYAGQGDDFAEKAAEAARDLRDELNRYRHGR